MGKHLVSTFCISFVFYAVNPAKTKGFFNSMNIIDANPRLAKSFFKCSIFIILWPLTLIPLKIGIYVITLKVYLLIIIPFNLTLINFISFILSKSNYKTIVILDTKFSSTIKSFLYCFQYFYIIFNFIIKNSDTSNLNIQHH